MAKISLATFDHPVVFLFFTTIAVFALGRLFGAGLRAAGLPGPASIFLS